MFQITNESKEEEDEMKRIIYLISVLSLFGVFIGGCATTPKIAVWQPWVRTLGDETRIKEGSRISIESVTGITEPLLGQETLLEEDIKETMIDLMQRKDVVVSDNNPDYRVSLSYLTECKDRLVSSTAYYSGSQSVHAYSGESYLGLAIATAFAVGSVSQTSVVAAKTSTVRSFTHTITLEIKDIDGNPFWKGDSSWDSNSLNMENEIIAALRLLYTVFPSNQSYIPTIRKIMKDKDDNYYRIHVKRRWFSSPLLPYRIMFRDQSQTHRLLHTIKNAEAFAAYIDLIQNAELVLPVGRRDYSDPLDDRLWRRVLIAGKYRLIPGDEEVNVMVELRGETAGYYVNKCWLASDDIYQIFQERMGRWQQALREYYDFWEKASPSEKDVFPF